MDKRMYSKIEGYMLECMLDSAHDCQHIYRVLYSAINISKKHKVDMEVVIASALLHDIGRQAQYDNANCDHAVVGAEMAFRYLKKIGWSEHKAMHVKDCIAAHRYRNDITPISIEAKIIFDSDKLDACGCLGIARTLLYSGIVAQPLYTVDEQGNALDGSDDEVPSFFREYNWKLKNLSNKLFTKEAKEIAEERSSASAAFYESIYKEVSNTHENGLQLLKDAIEPDKLL
jgi:uncharacterized protein